MCLGANCATTFQGVKYGVIILISALIHQNPLYGTQNQPCNSKLGKYTKL
jgi:hypothetical protein